MAAAPEGGHAWNNAPRYELAAYELQKLFLDPGDHVVPPTACRCFTPARYAALTGGGGTPEPTFEGTACVLTLLQYWLRNLRSTGVWDEDRLREDTVYARHLADLDVLTYLVEHKDANTGNFLISTVDGSPRVFAVDNGVSFRARPSPRGARWRWLRVERIPRRTAERLRRLTRAELRDHLGVLAQLELWSGAYRFTPPGKNLDPARGIRVQEGVIQLGLDDREIDDVWHRLRRLVERLNAGELEIF